LRDLSTTINAATVVPAIFGTPTLAAIGIVETIESLKLNPKYAIGNADNSRYLNPSLYSRK
jgi:hypothetical protein